MNQKPTKVISFTEQELQAFEVICDHALKSGGVRIAQSVVYFLQKFNSVPITESVPEVLPENVIPQK